MTTTHRVKLGPLTTTFIPPPFCSVYGAVANNASYNAFYQAQSCQSGQPKDWSTCWPPATITTQANPLAGFGFYSPGIICPSGYATACTQIAPARGASSVEIKSNSFSFQYPPLAGETAIGCCPPSLTCTTLKVNSEIWQTCGLGVTTGVIPVGFCASSGTLFDHSSSVTLGAFNDVSSLYAPMIQLMYQSTDTTVPASSNAMATSQGDTTNPTGTGTNTAGNGATVTVTATPSATNLSSTGDSGGLSSGAKIGIGIGVPLGMILIALCAFLLLRRRKATAAAGNPERQRHEMAADQKTHSEFPAEKSSTNRYEMGDHPTWIHEAGDTRSPPAVYELPHNASER